MNSWVRKTHWRRDRLPTPVFLGFTSGSAGKESTCNVEDLGLIPVLGRFPGKGKGYPLLYSGLENSMNCSPWGCKESHTNEELSLSQLLDHIVRICLVLKENTNLLFKERFSFDCFVFIYFLLCILAAFGVVNVLNFAHSHKCAVVSHCFNLHFPDVILYYI